MLNSRPATYLKDKDDTVYRNTSQEFLNMSHVEQKQFVKSELGFTTRQMNSYAFHHKENIGEIQLLNKSIHNAFRHQGGMSLWGVSHKID